MDMIRTQLKSSLLCKFDENVFSSNFEFCFKRSISLSNSFSWDKKYKPVITLEVSIFNLLLAVVCICTRVNSLLKFNSIVKSEDFTAKNSKILKK
jgi:hypothetical protein